MPKARRKTPPEGAIPLLEEIAERYSGRIRDKGGYWEAFGDAKIEGHRQREARPRHP